MEGQIPNFELDQNAPQISEASKNMLRSHMDQAKENFSSALDHHGLSIGTLSSAMAGFIQNILELPQGSACKKSCSYCCHLRVGVSIPEAIVIFEQIKANATEEGFEFLKQRVMGTAQKGDTLKEQWWLKSNTPCPFLDTQGQSLCLIYDLRPFSCRAYHSTDMDACLNGFEKKETVQIPCFTLYRAFTDMYSSIFIKSMMEIGLFSYQVGFVSALNILFEAQGPETTIKNSERNRSTPDSLVSKPLAPNPLIEDWFKGNDVFKRAKLK